MKVRDVIRLVEANGWRRVVVRAAIDSSSTLRSQDA
jgi:hypothetical protein